jgi:hypothetical protein
LGSSTDRRPDDVRWWEAYQLAASDETAELRRRAAAGDEHATWQLAGWLADRSRCDEAAALIRPLADAGDDLACTWLARWLSDERELSERALDGDFHALQALADILAVGGRADELRQVLCGADGRVRPELAGWLWRQGSIDVLEVGADAGDEDCQRRLARWRARHDERPLSSR